MRSWATRDPTFDGVGQRSRGPSARPRGGQEAILALQGQAGNRAVSAFIRQVQRLQDTDTNAAAAGSTARDITPEAVDGVASQLASDADTALGVRIPIEPGLLALASGAGADVALGSATETGSPAPTRDDAGAATGTVTGSKFGGDDLNPYRVAQGHTGDCYLMAAIAAVARVNPGAIRRLIRARPPGQYDVDLYEHRWLVSDAVHTETVDATVPVRADGSPLYGSGLQFRNEVEADRPLWPLLIEKAYAQWKGGYGAINMGYGSVGLETLTGHGADTYMVSQYSPSEIGRRIGEAKHDGKAVTASTAQLPPDVLGGGAGQSAGEHMGTIEGKTVVGGHSYAVENVEPAVSTVSLQNPWGYDHLQDLTWTGFKHVFNHWDVDTVG
jgi:Calpain family cysteine protease